MISQYNSQPPRLENLMSIVTKDITISGFRVFNISHKYQEFRSVLADKIGNGELKFLEHIYRGLDKAGHAFADVQRGNNLGKSLVIVAEE